MTTSSKQGEDGLQLLKGGGAHACTYATVSAVIFRDILMYASS